ncbi:peptide-methionine (S)-S-oxide reductase [Beijerinckiaceae bacterium]|nr:peptide-methionine (S)-S-oxide reductase [Beijerinckiaceae bacterium]
MGHLQGARLALPLIAFLMLVGIGLTLSPAVAEDAHVIPGPLVDSPVEQEAPTETAVLAGGCFWGVQGVFQHVRGVTNAVSGYAGGDRKTAQYEIVSEGKSGHAESVRVSFDPRQISYGRILQIYFSVAHDPTELNRQGPDSGTQYRSAIFPASPEQAKIAEAYIDQLNKAHVFGKAIVTKVEPDRTFYVAEGYHQDFLTKNPTYPYIVVNDLPKIDSLKRHFPDLYRPDPVLVSTARPTN